MEPQLLARQCWGIRRQSVSNRRVPLRHLGRKTIVTLDIQGSEVERVVRAFILGQRLLQESLHKGAPTPRSDAAFETSHQFRGQTNQ
jgi:hypothetical protein